MQKVSVSPAVHPEQRPLFSNVNKQTVIQTLGYAVITDSGLGAREQVQQTTPRAEELRSDRTGLHCGTIRRDIEHVELLARRQGSPCP